MVTYRFRGRHSAVSSIMTEKGHRDDPSKRRKPSERGRSSAQTPEIPLALLPAPDVPAVHVPDLDEVQTVFRPSRQGGVTVLRHKIMDSGVVDALIDFVEGRRDLSPEQVATGIALAKKIVPDLATAALPPEDDEASETASPEFEIHIVDPKA